MTPAPMAGARSAPETDDDPYSLDNLNEPYPMHQRWREAGNVVLLRRYGVYALTGYADVNAALRDHATFTSSAGVGLADFRRQAPWRPPSPLLEADPPRHTTARTAMTTVLSFRALREFRPAFQAEADRLVDELIDRACVDAITDIAEAYPLKVFPDVVGLTDQGRAGLLPYGDMNFNSFGPANELQRDSFSAAEPLHAWMDVSCRRENLAPGGLGARLWDLTDSGTVDDEQANLLVRALLTAGVDTTVCGLGNTFHAFADHPDQWGALHHHPEHARFAFDEALRFESPIQSFYRTTGSDVEVDGVRIRAGRKVQLFFGAANRDPQRWGDDAQRLDVNRDASGHVAFGMGIHQCVGQPIARLEAEVLLSTLARRVKAIEPIGPAVPRLNNTLRGWTSLPIRLIPA